MVAGKACREPGFSECLWQWLVNNGNIILEMLHCLIYSKSDTALWPDWHEVVFCHAGNTYAIVFVEEHSLRVLSVHLAKSWHKYHLPDVAGKCTDQSVGHQWHHTTRLRKSDVGSYFRQFHEDYHDPINGSFLKGSIWIINSQIDGLVVAVPRIGHHGHRIWTH